MPAECDVSGALVNGTECQMDVGDSCPVGRRAVELGSAKACALCRAGEPLLLLPALTRCMHLVWLCVQRGQLPGCMVHVSSVACPFLRCCRHIFSKRQQLHSLRSWPVRKQRGGIVLPLTLCSRQLCSRR